MPAPFAAVVAILEAGRNVGKGDGEAALKCLERAEKLNPDMPIRHAIRAACLNLLGNHPEALTAADAYIALLGPDSDIDLQRGLALEGLNRHGEAATAYRRSLDDGPNEVGSFDGLRRVLPDPQKGELAERLAKARDPGKFFNVVVVSARQGHDEAAIEAYEQGLLKACPNDPNAIVAGIRRMVTAKKFSDAATEMKAALRRVPRDQQRQVLNAYLFAMVGADRIAEAYATTPNEHAASGFRTLAAELADSDDSDVAPPLEKSVKQLRELIAAHRKRFPADAWSGFYEGMLLQNAKEYEKAEQAFADAQKVYLKTVKPKIKDKDWDADQFRFHRVECLLALKQGPKAFAEVGPMPDTFVQLADAYEREKDLESLEEMVDAFQEKHRGESLGAFWGANVLYLKGKYSEAAADFRKYLDTADEKDSNRWTATDRCVRGYLRANRLGDARNAVNDFGTERVSAGLRLAVVLANNRPAQADSLLAELAKKPGGHGFVYYDEDFARIIAKPEFATLKKKYPDPRPAKPLGPAG